MNALANAKNFLSIENAIKESYNNTLMNFIPSKNYDICYTSHTNYYWALTQDDFNFQLDKLISIINDE